jgi:ADP-ribose pyrophosphatase YjhB (NUDIX family)
MYSESSSAEPRALDWVRRLAALAQSGLAFTKDAYDRERYEAIRRIAAEMTAAIGELDVRRVLEALSAEEGYATPKVDVRGVVFRDGGILLVRERADGGWTLPGGWADPWRSPRQSVETEVEEESGWVVRATKLLAFLDRTLQGHEPPHPFRTYKAFFRCEIVGGEPRPCGIETTDVGFFREDAIPPLSRARTTVRQIGRFFEHLRDPLLPTDFD